MLRSQSYFICASGQLDHILDAVVVHRGDGAPAAFVGEHKIPYADLLDRYTPTVRQHQRTFRDAWVVDDQDVGALTGDTTAHAGRHVTAASASDAPLLISLKVGVQPRVEDALVRRVIENFLHLAAKGHGERHVVRAGDHLVIRVPAQVPGGEHPGGKL